MKKKLAFRSFVILLCTLTIIIWLLNSNNFPLAPEFFPSTTIPSSVPTFTPTNLQELTNPTANTTMTPTLLLPDQQDALILELMQEISDCRLPCWGGIRPGTTTWDEAKSMLGFLSFETNYEVYGDYFSSYLVLKASLPESPFDRISIDLAGQQNDNIVQYISITGIENFSFYSLPSLLTRYGPPGEIWVNTFSSWTTVDGEPPFLIFLYYPRNGALALYATNASIRDEIIYACVNEVTTMKIRTPTNEMSYSQVMTLFYSGGFDGDTLSSADAFGLTVNEFYEKYKDSDDPCFETPKKKWSGIDGSTPEP